MLGTNRHIQRQGQTNSEDNIRVDTDSDSNNCRWIFLWATNSPKNKQTNKTPKQTNKQTKTKIQDPNSSVLPIANSGIALMSSSGLVCKIKGVIMKELQCLFYETHTAILSSPFFSSLPFCISLAQVNHKRIKREVEKVDL